MQSREGVMLSPNVLSHLGLIPNGNNGNTRTREVPGEENTRIPWVSKPGHPTSPAHRNSGNSLTQVKVSTSTTTVLISNRT